VTESRSVDGAPASEEELGRLERLALRYLEKRERRRPTEPHDDDVHVLNPEERRALRAIERNVVIRAALIGACTAGLAAFVEIEAMALLGEDPDVAPWQAQLEFWLVVGPMIGVMAVLEIGLLYWDSLRSVHDLARAAGLEIFEGPRGLAVAMARAALEMPNPRTGAEGIDAHREASKIWLVTIGLLYKAKVGITAFLVKALVRRAAGRSLVRAWLVWVGVPITALWDALVAWKVIREARLRAMGPSAAREVADALFPDDGTREKLTPEARDAALMAVGGCIVRTQDRHPNLLALLDALEHEIGEVRDEVVLDDSERFVAQVEKLEDEERERVLEVFAVSAVIDGRLTRGERELFERIQQLAGRRGTEGLAALRKRFLRGEEITRAQVRTAIGEDVG